MYKNNMQKILSSQGIDWSTYGKLIMGGEATMWSEQSDEFTVEVKTFGIMILKNRKYWVFDEFKFNVNLSQGDLYVIISVRLWNFKDGGS